MKTCVFSGLSGHIDQKFWSSPSNNSGAPQCIKPSQWWEATMMTEQSPTKVPMVNEDRFGTMIASPTNVVCSDGTASIPQLSINSTLLWVSCGVSARCNMGPRLYSYTYSTTLRATSVLIGLSFPMNPMGKRASWWRYVRTWFSRGQFSNSLKRAWASPVIDFTLRAIIYAPQMSAE